MRARSSSIFALFASSLLACSSTIEGHGVADADTPDAAAPIGDDGGDPPESDASDAGDSLDAGADAAPCHVVGETCADDCCGATTCATSTDRVVCLCESAGAPCHDANDCCTGLACSGGVCVSPASCVGVSDAPCDGGCCGALQCLVVASLDTRSCCAPVGRACRTSRECCGSTRCIDGLCACRASQDACRQGQDCCSGVCMQGSCK